MQEEYAKDVGIAACWYQGITKIADLITRMGSRGTPEREIPLRQHLHYIRVEKEEKLTPIAS